MPVKFIAGGTWEMFPCLASADFPPPDFSLVRCGQGTIPRYFSAETMPVHDLEPVAPDPKKLRRTAWILVAIMFVGGFVILKAYSKRAKEATSDDRPSFVTQISQTKDLTFMDQDGKVRDLMSLKGKVLVVQSMPQAQPDGLSNGVMKRLAGEYAGNGGSLARAASSGRRRTRRGAAAMGGWFQPEGDLAQIHQERVQGEHVAA
jgi:hypothetical protein